MILNIRVVAFIVASLTFLGCEERAETYRSTSEVATAMTALLKQKRYDKAVKVGQGWIAAHPNDALIHQQIGIALLLNAQKDPLLRQDLLNRASESFDSAIRVAPDDALSLNDAAWGFISVADLSSSDSRCAFYEKAKATFHRQEQLLLQDRYWIRGESFSMEPLRNVHEKAISQLSQKMSEAKCPYPR